jgi:hypothetical protein
MAPPMATALGQRTSQVLRVFANLGLLAITAAAQSYNGSSKGERSRELAVWALTPQAESRLLTDRIISIDQAVNPKEQ